MLERRVTALSEHVTLAPATRHRPREPVTVAATGSLVP
jgi:hypothetical protein